MRCDCFAEVPIGLLLYSQGDPGRSVRRSDKNCQNISTAVRAFLSGPGDFSVWAGGAVANDAIPTAPTFFNAIFNVIIQHGVQLCTQIQN